MLSFLATLFVLFITIFLGYYVGKGVPDEVKPAHKWLSISLDALLLVMIALLLYPNKAAFIVPIIVLICRKFFHFDYVYAPLTGVIIGFSFLLSSDLQIMILVVCLVFNFILGMTKRVSLYLLAQPLGALLVYIMFLNRFGVS